MARKYAKLELLQFIERYLDGNSYRTLVNNYNLKLPHTPFRNYVKKCERHGIEGINSRKKDRGYTKKFKSKVVSEQLNQGYGIHHLANKYSIPSKTTVQNWINLYTKGKENVKTSPLCEVYSMDKCQENSVMNFSFQILALLFDFNTSLFFLSQ